jgi:hypothetical protein
VKISRVLFAVLLIATAGHAAVAPPPPPKPPADGPADPVRDAWRARGVAICVGDMHGAEGVTPDELEATCGCTVDQFMTRLPTPGLPVLAPGRTRALMGGPLVLCASDQRPAVTAAIARQLAAPPPVDPPPLVGSADSKPVETPLPAPADAAKRSGADSGPGLAGLSLPTWLTDSGMPAWAWSLLILLVFLVLRGLKRGGDQRDLIGPPPNMRLGARANPPAPRRADPPQRI